MRVLTDLITMVSMMPSTDVQNFFIASGLTSIFFKDSVGKEKTDSGSKSFPN